MCIEKEKVTQYTLESTELSRLPFTLSMMEQLNADLISVLVFLATTWVAAITMKRTILCVDHILIHFN